jgi:outer membrane protein assembly factor BamE (lipoprotein component of BamABCDE complex)
MVASCTPMVENRGHSPEKEDFAQIILGQSRSEDVQAVFGSPTTTSNYGEKIWYYIATRKETKGFLAPKITQQKVVAVIFDADDTVKDIEKYKKEDGKPVELVSKETPAEGRTLGVVEQLLGNFGKFSAPGRSVNPGSVGSPGRI